MKAKVKNKKRVDSPLVKTHKKINDILDEVLHARAVLGSVQNELENLTFILATEK